MSFINTGKEVEKLEGQLNLVYDVGGPQDEVVALEDEISSAKGERIFSGLLLTFLSAGVVGIFIVVYLLPFFAHKVTHAIYDSGEEVEKDVMREAHSLLAQGEYEGAIEAFKKAAEDDPHNRLPWVEISKIYRTHLHDSTTAIATLREALESREWVVDDAAYLMFRLAELYDEDFGDRATARTIMRQVTDDFSETRHSANAIHKMRDWDTEEEDAAKHAEEQEFLARQQAHGGGDSSNPSV